MKVKSEDKLISVVLPNYNGKELLESYLPSLLSALDKSRFSYEIIIADDCSTDDSIQFLEANYPEIKILKNDINRGFSATCNLGIRNSSAKYTCVSNTDVSFHEDYFINSINVLEKQDVFAVKGDILNYDNSFDNVINIDKTTRMYFKKGFLRFRTGFAPGEKHTDILEYSALGCCFICRTDLLKSLGGFDEIFSPYYWEDSDLAIRAIKKGYPVIYVPECIVYHKLSSTITATQKDFKRKLIGARNKFIFSWHHMSGGGQWFNHLLFLILSLMTRWLILDFKYYAAFILALKRVMTFQGNLVRT